MSVVVPNQILHSLKTKAFLYDATIQPIVTKYEHLVSGLTVAVIILVVTTLIFALMYKYQKSLTKFYKECLNANFYWNL